MPLLAISYILPYPVPLDDATRSISSTLNHYQDCPLINRTMTWFGQVFSLLRLGLACSWSIFLGFLARSNWMITRFCWSACAGSKERNNWFGSKHLTDVNKKLCLCHPLSYLSLLQFSPSFQRVLLLMDPPSRPDYKSLSAASSSPEIHKYPPVPSTSWH